MLSKERDIGIDVLKCVAALLITNSHMDVLYGGYSYLATGGCIGDVLFFFCSGFTLFLKPFDSIIDFPNWYKRRVVRIYPSIIAVAIIGGIFGLFQWNITDIILARRYWFISCIMLYYIAIYIVGLYFREGINLIIILDILVSGIWFFFIKNQVGFSIYGGHYIRWLLFFTAMLLGADIGMKRDKLVLKILPDVLLLVISVICFYSLFILGGRVLKLRMLQYFSFIPLLFILFYSYKVASSQTIKKLLSHRWVAFLIRFIGGLCLEIYLVQFFVISDSFNHLFPLNILIIFLLIIVAAYIVRCLARFIIQTFSLSPYNWKDMLKLL